MKTKPMAFLACRIIAIVLFFQFLSTAYSTVFFGFMSFYSQYQGTPQMLLIALGLIGPMVLLLATCIILWVWADAISSRMVRSIDGEETGIQVGSRELQIAGFSIVGLAILALTIPTIFQVIPTLINLGYYDTGAVRVEIAFLIVDKIVRMAIGLYLLLGSRVFVRIIGSIRNSGLHNLTDADVCEDSRV